MLSCSEVLARHSEYIDGEMQTPDSERWRVHLATCSLCARYDRVLRKGVRLLHGEDLQADPEFVQHLRYRVADEQQRMSQPIGMNASAAITVAAVLALAVLLPMMMSKSDATTAAASELDVTAVEIAWHGGDAVHQTQEHSALPAPRPVLQAPRLAVSHIDDGYSPLIVESPTAPPSYTR